MGFASIVDVQAFDAKGLSDADDRPLRSGAAEGPPPAAGGADDDDPGGGGGGAAAREAPDPPERGSPNS